MGLNFDKIKITDEQQRLSALSEKQYRAGKNVRTYSRFVRFMKLTLPVTALAIIGLLFVWPEVENTVQPIMQESTNMIPQTIGKNELVNPRFESIDEENRPFIVTASRAVQSARDPDVVLLDAPDSVMILDDLRSVSAKAERGAYRQQAERLLLEGNVVLTYEGGYEMRTEKLQVNVGDRSAFSDMNVAVTGPEGSIHASGMKADGAGEVLVFTGPVKMILNRAVEGLDL